MADRGCEVHSFDPSVRFEAKHRQHAKRGVHFHPWGLQTELTGACGNDQSAGNRRWGGAYGALSDKLYSLSTILSRLGHEKRRVDLLKIDCEGCEFDAFYQMAREQPSPLQNVRAIHLELHMTLPDGGSGLGVSAKSNASIAKVHALYTFLFQTLGFQLWWLRQNPGFYGVPTGKYRIHPVLKHLDRPPKGVQHACCYELGLVRSEIASMPRTPSV